jgi:hypothetical protein
VQTRGLDQKTSVWKAQPKYRSQQSLRHVIQPANHATLVRFLVPMQYCQHTSAHFLLASDLRILVSLRQRVPFAFPTTHFEMLYFVAMLTSCIHFFRCWTYKIFSKQFKLVERVAQLACCYSNLYTSPQFPLLKRLSFAEQE